VSLVAVSVLGSARAQSPAELSQVSGQEGLTNRFESPVSETDRLSDGQQHNAYFFAPSQDQLRCLDIMARSSGAVARHIAAAILQV
jgi:hypothetical protein